MVGTGTGSGSGNPFEIKIKKIEWGSTFLDKFRGMLLLSERYG